MNFQHPYFLIMFIAGSILLLMGITLKKWPPKTPNWAYGYRSKSAVKSQERWDFAQLYTGRKLIKSGVITILFAFIGLYFKINEISGLLLSIGYIFIIFIYIYFKTENAIKEKFPPK